MSDGANYNLWFSWILMPWLLERKTKTVKCSICGKTVYEGFAESTEDFRIVCDACRAAQALNDRVLSPEEPRQQQKYGRIDTIQE